MEPQREKNCLTGARILPCTACTHSVVRVTHGTIMPIIIPMVGHHYTLLERTSLFSPQKFGQKSVHYTPLYGKIQCIQELVLAKAIRK